MEDMKPSLDAIVNMSLHLQHVPRWVVIPTIKKQTVAEHSYNVAVLTYWLCIRLGKDANTIAISVLKALVHDSSEAITGDMPSPIKRNVPPAENEGELLVKVADSIESILFIRHEYDLGHRNLADILQYNQDKLKERMGALGLNEQQCFELEADIANAFFDKPYPIVAQMKVRR